MVFLRILVFIIITASGLYFMLDAAGLGDGSGIRPFIMGMTLAFIAWAVAAVVVPDEL